MQKKASLLEKKLGQEQLIYYQVSRGYGEHHSQNRLKDIGKLIQQQAN
jgi:hypothetical protein